MTGKSNRRRIKTESGETRLADHVEVALAPPKLEYTNEHAPTDKWQRPVALFEPPQLIRTKLGGTVMRPSSRCTASRFSERINEHFDEHHAKVFAQPEWSNTQPLLGVPEWNPGEATLARAEFSVTDDAFES